MQFEASHAATQTLARPRYLVTCWISCCGRFANEWCHRWSKERARYVCSVVNGSCAVKSVVEIDGSRKQQVMEVFRASRCNSASEAHRLKVSGFIGEGWRDRSKQRDSQAR